MAPIKPRILVTTTTLPRFSGDPEPRFVLDLARALSDFADMTILAPRSPGTAAEEELEGVRVIRYGYAPFRAIETLTAPGAILHNLKARPLRILLVPLLLLGLARAMRRLVKAEGFDLVHAHWLIPQGLVQAFFGPEHIPFVVTSHGSDVFALKSPFFAAMRRFVLGRAAAVTVVSDALRQAIPVAAVIPMGVDLSAFTGDVREESGRLRILFAGRLAEGKGVQVLLEALALLDGDASELTVVGDGPMRGRLEALTGTLGIRDRVRFAGGVAHDRLPEFYRAADLFVMPSITSRQGEREGLPVVLLEAAASSLPLVGSDLGGIPEIVRDGETGLLVPENDPKALASAIAILARDPALRRQYGAAAHALALNYGWAAVAEKYRKIFSGLLDKKAA